MAQPRDGKLALEAANARVRKGYVIGLPQFGSW